MRHPTPLLNALPIVAALHLFACGTDSRLGADAAAIPEADSGADSSTATSAGPEYLTGTVDGTDAWVGAVRSSDQVRIFFCGGKTSYSTLTAWFRTSLDTSGNLVVAQNPGLMVSGRFDGSVVQGSLGAPDGGVLPFRAERVGAGSLGGIYETTAPCGHVGLIVSNESPPTGQGACIGPGDTPSVKQVNPLSPIALTPDGTILVKVDGSNETASVSAALAN
jgi:hypothetical protein